MSWAVSDERHAEYREAEAALARVRELQANWLRLLGGAIDPDVREWLTAVTRSLDVALAPTTHRPEESLDE